MTPHPYDPIEQRVNDLCREFRPPLGLDDLTAIDIRLQHDGTGPVMREAILGRLLEHDFEARQPGDELRTLAGLFRHLDLGPAEDAPAELLVGEFRYRQRIGHDPGQCEYEGYKYYRGFLELLRITGPREGTEHVEDTTHDAAGRTGGGEVGEPPDGGRPRPARLWSYRRKRLVLGAGLIGFALAVVPLCLLLPRPQDPPLPSADGGLPKTFSIRLSDAEPLDFVLIDPVAQPDGGRFRMGSSKTQAVLVGGLGWKLSDDEEERDVSLARPYYLGRTEVTRGQFDAFLRATGTKSDAEVSGGHGWNDAKPGPEHGGKYSWHNPGFRQSDAHPAVLISWNDATRFARWLGERARAAQQLPAPVEQRGWTAGLPSEARWEYACRAGSRFLFAFGDEVSEIVHYANGPDGLLMNKLGRPPDTWKELGVATPDGHLFTAPVGSYRANGFGLCDMHGNVWEWCEDFYAGAAPLGDDPVRAAGAAKGPRVLRGGSWRYFVTGCRSAYRHRDAPDAAWCDYGFRVCIVLDR